MGKRVERRSAQDWQVLIAEWQGSGIDLGEFCRERRIAPSSLRWWRWRLGISSDRGSISAVSAAGCSTQKGNNWIQLEIETSGSNRSAFEVRWPSGRILRIPADFEAEALGRLLATMERSAC